MSLFLASELFCAEGCLVGKRDVFCSLVGVYRVCVWVDILLSVEVCVMFSLDFSFNEQ